MMDLLLFICLIFLFLFIYFVPTFLADECSTKKFKAVLVFNILLGWTVIGWVVAIIWAVTGNNEEED